jgi:hypothetical protein
MVCLMLMRLFFILRGGLIIFCCAFFSDKINAAGRERPVYSNEKLLNIEHPTSNIE